MWGIRKQVQVSIHIHVIEDPGLLFYEEKQILLVE